MPGSPSPRYTSQSDFEAYLRTQGNSVPKQTVLPILLAAAETMVERYCRRRFAPSPALSATYTRQVVQVSGVGLGTGVVPAVAGPLAFSFDGAGPATLQLPITASELQGALQALSSVGAGNVVCSGGPLPSYPISVTWQGALEGEQPLLAVDGSGLAEGFVDVFDMGYDSLPPVARRFTTRGKTTVRVPDLRTVDAAADPRLPNSGGIQLFGRRLLPGQYSLGSEGYGLGGEAEAFGTAEYAEPATHLTLGYGYGQGIGLAEQFAFVLPIGAQSNDLAITGRWGWYPTPPDVLDAVYAVGSRRWSERNAMFSDQMITPEGLTLAFFKQLPAAVQGTLATYRVPHIDIL